MTAKITRLKLSGYKSVADADIILHDLNVLIGANGAGKSNLLSLFQLLARLPPSSPDETPRPFRLDGGLAALLHDGLSATRAAGADIVFDINGATAETRIALTPGAAPDTALATRQTQPWALAAACDGALAAAFHQFHDTSAAAAIKRAGPAADCAALRPDGGNLAAFLLALRDARPKYYRRIVESARQMAPFFDDFALEAVDGAVALRWREFDSDMVFEAPAASDGLLRLWALTTALLQPLDLMPPLLIFDEPELGLHPHAIVIIGGLIRAAAVDRQVIVATQSPLLLDQFGVDDVIVAERAGRATAFHRLDRAALREWLEDYTLGDLWRKNVLGGQPEDGSEDDPR